MNISIVIPNWNGLELIKQSFDSFVSTSKNFKGRSEIIVIDNGSDDRSLDVIADFYPQIITVSLDKNYGFGYACNEGARRSQYEHILFLNNDLCVPTDFLNILSNSFSKHKNIFSLCPHTYHWHGTKKTNNVFSTSISFEFLQNGELIQNWAVKDNKALLPGDIPTAYGTGAALLVDKKKFNSLGGFDSLYGKAYWEDVDLCVKAWRNGWASYTTDQTLAWHKVSSTSKKQENDQHKDNLMRLNYILFMLSIGTDWKHKYLFLKQLTRFLKNNKTTNPQLAIFIKKNLISKLPRLLFINFFYLLFFWKNLKQMKSQSTTPSGSWKSQPILEA